MNVPMLLTPKGSTTYIRVEAGLEEGIQRLRESGYTAVPVLNDEGMYLGTVGSADFLAYILERGPNALAEGAGIEEIVDMRRSPAVGIEAGLDEVLERMMDSNFVPVVDGRGCFVGIITRKRMLRYLREKLREG